jgi:GTP-binding protein YchF
MKLGIIGLPQTGKKSLFELLTSHHSSMSAHEAHKTVAGQAAIRDIRFDNLVKLFDPKKEVPAKIDLLLFPKIEAATLKEENILSEIALVDAICHVVRAFEDESIYHLKGSVNPARDIEDINAELVLHDLLFIEKRMERIEKGSQSKKKGDKEIEDEVKLLEKFREHLEKDLHLRTLETSPEEEKIIASYPFLTRKKMLVVLNAGDESAGDTSMLEELSGKYSSLDLDIMQVSAKLEYEISELDSEEEREEFLKDAGISEPALNKLSQLSMKTLGLISFFTVGKDEVRQWLIRNGALAPEAGGAIHSDIERGFIRAEVMKYEDIIEHGSEEALKKVGKFHVHGKEYQVLDGDIVHYRFNV